MGMRAGLFLLISICLFTVNGLAANQNAPAVPVGKDAAAVPAPVPDPALSQKAKSASDASRAVESVVTAPKDYLSSAAKYQKSIADITGADKKRTTPPLEDLQTIQATVQAIQQTTQAGRQDLIDTLSKDKDALDGSKANSLEAARVTACSALTQAIGGSQQLDAVDADAECVKAQQQAQDELKMIGDAISSLQGALQGIFKYFQTQVAALGTSLKSLNDLVPPTPAPGVAAPAAPDAAALEKVLSSGLPALKQAMDNSGQYQSTWGATKAPLKSLLATAPAPPAGATTDTDVDNALTALGTQTGGIVSQLRAWFGIVQADLLAAATSLDGKLAPVATDPALNSATAVGALRDLGDKIASVQPILDAWPPLVGFLTDGKPSTFDLKSTKTAFESLQTEQNVARGSVSRMHDALAGDMAEFETDQVSLYYFTDITRLMHALNENVQTVGGVAEAQAQAAAQRIALTQTELDLADAQATVNRYQKQVLDLQEQQRQLQAKFKNVTSQTTKLASKLKAAQDVKTQADTNYSAAQSDQTANPNDPTKAAALKLAATKQTAEATKVSQAQSDYDSAKSQQDATQGQLDNSQNQSDSLPAKLDTAQQALSAAQSSVSQERRKMLMAAQAESDAFAFARDNTPYLYAPAMASSSDPAKRVILYAFNDSKTIFMRGKAADLREVKTIIAKFDTPAPQARLTLWTFELDADAGQKTNAKSADKLNVSMEIVDEELSNTRAGVNTTLALFKQLVNDEVRKVETAELAAQPAGGFPAKASLQWEERDKAKWRRAHIYDPSVLAQLGITLDPAPNLDRFRSTLPDPSGTTTLGEALMVLSLMSHQSRIDIRDEFETQFSRRLGVLQPIVKHGENGEDPGTDFKRTKHPLLLTWQALGVEPTPNTDKNAPPPCNCPKLKEDVADSLSSSQLEISRALLAAQEAKFGGRLESLSHELKQMYQDLSTAQAAEKSSKEQIAALEAKGVGQLTTAQKTQLNSLQTQVAQNQNELRGLTSMQNPTPADVQRRNNLQATAQQFDDLTHRAVALLSSEEQSSYAQQKITLKNVEARIETIQQTSVPIMGQLTSHGYVPVTGGSNESQVQALTRFREQYLIEHPPGETAPRVAAADEMLKEIIIAVEDDLDRLFIQPMISRLRTRLIAEKGVRVGILQRESLLATNRGVARIDPSASAQLAVGEQEDILTGVMQLAQLYATVQSGGALAALGALQEQPREPQPEIYALTTGNKFQVTPVFDPTGQALRFKFDFVASSKLQEPNGTTNPQMPRIERHTVNTEVQLSNLETREISRFEVNSKLGLPTTYWGGLPIFKDIPGFRPWVPLIGWFVRKGGSNASAQQSVIFGQTTMYPTISSIVDLLSQPQLPN
jgi:hypothetical protein